MSQTDKFPILQITEQGRINKEDIVVREFSITIVLNNQELATLLCSPAKLDYLAIGFLLSEGLLKSKDEIKNITVDEDKGLVQVETKEKKKIASGLPMKPIIGSSGGKGLHVDSAATSESPVKIDSKMKVSAHDVFNLVKEFVHRSEVFKATGGVHSAALCDTNGILVFSEDIGRHNAIDKVIGECMLKDIPLDNHIIVPVEGFPQRYCAK